MTEAPSPVFSPVRKSVTVKAAPEAAFRRFTAGMASWWPLRSHSVGGEEAETVAMEGRVGGRIVERIRGGRECTWGTVTAWDPPRRVAFTWHPGDEPARAQDVEVRFTPEGDRTRVELEHRGFERLGGLARKARRGYPIGWAYVLGLYASRRGPFMLAVTGLTAALMAVQRWRAKPEAPGGVAPDRSA
ncbi:MAG TPA: SRPBCC family protein [Vicinamibacteria bacterium]|jgi:uncharacterized protein YndB with AHSA1/START domain